MRLIGTCRVHFRSRVGRRTSGEAGVALVEYGLLIAFIAVVCLAAVAYVGGWATDTLNSAGELL